MKNDSRYMGNKMRIRGATSTIVVAGVLALAACDAGPEVQKFAFPVTAGDSAADPALAVDPSSGDVVSSWMTAPNGKWIIQVARSKDMGVSWSKPVSVSTTTESISPHSESAPRLVVTPQGVIAVAWSDSRAVPGRQWPASNIRFSRSTDGGSTWSGAITLNDDTLTGPSGHLFHGAATAGDSGIVVAWMDSRVTDSAQRQSAITRNAGNAEHAAHGVQSDAEPDAQVMFAHSADGGLSWSTRNAVLSPSACPCCRITLASMPAGAGVIGAWRQHLGSNLRDIVTARVWPDASSPVRVHNDNWVFPGCPHAGPGISVGQDGSAHVSWYTGVTDKAGLYYAVATPSGVFGKAVPLSVGKNHPVTHSSIATSSNGLSLVAWEDTSSVDRSVAVALVSEEGKVTWSRVLPESAGADHPQVAALPDGKFIVAWAMRSTAGPRVAGVIIRN
jgi:hypothetical protein